MNSTACDYTPKAFWVAQEGGVSTPVIAYESGVPGLVLHRPLGDPQNGDEFLVTHEASGAMVLPYTLEGLQKAAEAAERLGVLTDWTQPGPVIQKALKGTDVTRAVKGEEVSA